MDNTSQPTDSRRGLVVHHVIHTTVASADAEWVRFDGSQERMYFGPDHGYVTGQRVKIIIEKEMTNVT